VEDLRHVDAHRFGVVLNMAPTKGPDAYRYGSGRYDYRPREVGTEALPRTRRLKAADIVPGMRAGDGRRSVS